MSEALALVAGWILLLILAVAVIAALALAARRILLGRSGGTVECGLRASQGAAWRLGIATYELDQLQWFSAFGVRLRPNEVFERGTLSVLARRPAAQAEALSLGAGTMVVECQTSRERGLASRAAAPCAAPRTVELAMSPEALTGFLAWLEAAPPGRVSRLS